MTGVFLPTLFSSCLSPEGFAEKQKKVLSLIEENY
jgi:hypothetical protein